MTIFVLRPDLLSSRGEKTPMILNNNVKKRRFLKNEKRSSYNETRNERTVEIWFAMKSLRQRYKTSVAFFSRTGRNRNVMIKKRNSPSIIIY